MGAGISNKQDRDLKRSRLISICRELVKAGVPAVYDGMRVSGPGFDVRFGTTVRCCNGEAFGNLIVTAMIPEMPKEDWQYEVECGDTELGFDEWKQHMLDSHADVIERYGFLEATDYGLKRLKALYGNAEHQAKRTETELAWLIVKIEREAKCQSVGPRAKGPIFLYRADGTLWPTPDCFVMKPGQLYAYNEMQDGKPMLRVRGGVGADSYTEFLPGMYVRRGDGKMVAERKL